MSDVQPIHDFTALLDNEATLERIAEGAEMCDLTMVQWVLVAITNQWVRDKFLQWEDEGLVVRTGEYRNGEPVFVDAGLLGKNAN